MGTKRWVAGAGGCLVFRRMWTCERKGSVLGKGFRCVRKVSDWSGRFWKVLEFASKFLRLWNFLRGFLKAHILFDVFQYSGNFATFKGASEDSRIFWYVFKLLQIIQTSSTISLRVKEHSIKKTVESVSENSTIFNAPDYLTFFYDMLEN